MTYWIRWVTHLALSRNIWVEAIRYKTLRRIFIAKEINLNDLDKKARRLLCKKIFYFKFEKSCSNARYVRAGKKKGYENVKRLRI